MAREIRMGIDGKVTLSISIRVRRLDRLERSERLEQSKSMELFHIRSLILNPYNAPVHVLTVTVHELRSDS